MRQIKSYIKRISIFLLIAFISFGLVSCKLFKKCKHVDANDDAKCDLCGKDFEDGIDIEQPIPEESVKATLEEENIFIGSTTKIDVEFSSEVSDKSYQVAITDPTIVSYANDTFTGLKPGTTEITVTCTGVTGKVSTTVSLTVMPDLETEVFDAGCIATAHGEDASTSAMVKYETHNKNTSVEYTIASDTEFSNAIKVIGSCYYFCELSEQLEGPFSERYIYRTYLENLNPDTEYIYRINKGDNTYSDIYSFKTAKGSGPTTFIYLTDTHYWVQSDGTSHGSEISEDTIAAIKAKHPEATLVIDSGDTIDTGGNDKIWQMMYQLRTSLKTLAYASVPGNHEYYVKTTGQWDNRFFKAMSPSLLNGPDCILLGSSYYFIYNDVLFIMVDNVKSTGHVEQVAWMEDLLRNQDYKYSVVNYHIPTHEGGTDQDEIFNNLFQKYAVDLVLSGHYHTEDYDFIYNNQDIGSGTAGSVFFRGGSSGVKGGTPVGYAITFSEEGHITIQSYDTSGNPLNKFEFDTLKYKEPTVTGDVKINMNVDKENAKVTFNWGKEPYAIYERVIVTEEYRGNFSQEILLLSDGYDSVTAPLDRPGYDSLFKVEMFKADGTSDVSYYKITDATATLTTSADTNSVTCTLTQSTDILFEILISHYDVYVNGEKVGQINYTKAKHIINNLSSNTNYKIEFKAIDSQTEKVAYVLETEVKTK